MLINNFISSIGSVLFILFLPSTAVAYSCWSKPHEPEAVVVGRIINIQTSQTTSDYVTYTLETDTWLKGTSEATIVIEVNNSINVTNKDKENCSIPFTGELGETWAFQSFTSQEGTYVFDHHRGIMLSNSEGKVLTKIPRWLIEFYQVENKAKGDVYQSKLEYEWQWFWYSLRETLRSKF